MDQIYEEEVDNLKMKLRDRLNLPYHNHDLKDKRYHIGNQRQPTSAFSQIRQSMDNMGGGDSNMMGPRGQPSMDQNRATNIGPNGPPMMGPGGPQMMGPGGPQMMGPGGPQMMGPNGQQIMGPGGPQMMGPNGSHMMGSNGPHMMGPNGQQMMGPSGQQMMGPGGPSMMGPGGPHMMGPGGDNMPFNMNQMQPNVGLFNMPRQNMGPDAQQQFNMPPQNMGEFRMQQQNMPGTRPGLQGMNQNTQGGPAQSNVAHGVKATPSKETTDNRESIRAQQQRNIRPLMPETEASRQQQHQQQARSNVQRGNVEEQEHRKDQSPLGRNMRGNQQMVGKEKQRMDDTADRDESIEGPLNIVSVLRLLTALEDHLGILGPRVVDLMSKALTYEKVIIESMNFYVP